MTYSQQTRGAVTKKQLMTQGFGLQQALDDKRLNQILTQAREK